MISLITDESVAHFLNESMSWCQKISENSDKCLLKVLTQHMETFKLLVDSKIFSLLSYKTKKIIKSSLRIWDQWMFGLQNNIWSIIKVDLMICHLTNELID